MTDYTSRFSKMIKIDLQRNNARHRIRDLFLKACDARHFDNDNRQMIYHGLRVGGVLSDPNNSHSTL